MSKEIELPDEYVSTNFEANVAIMQRINEILWQERMEALMAAVAQKLVDVGVDFSKADINKLTQSET